MNCFDLKSEDSAKKEFKMVLGIEILHGEKIQEFPAGLGRSFPNQNPYLPPPKQAYGFNPNNAEEFMKGFSIMSYSNTILFFIGFFLITLILFTLQRL